MLPQNDPNFLTYRMSDFLDNSCLTNDTTNTDFSHIEQIRTFILCLKAKIS
jgi:hypothetical protein